MKNKLRYYVDVALAIGSQTTAIWLVFPEDLDPSLRGIGKVYPLGLEEAAEVPGQK